MHDSRLRAHPVLTRFSTEFQSFLCVSANMQSRNGGTLVCPLDFRRLLADFASLR